jgi:hypothetical protein
LQKFARFPFSDRSAFGDRPFVCVALPCRGPLELDLAGFPGRAEEAFPIIDDDLLETLRLVRSLTVSSKCWDQFGRAPEVDEAAHFHLRTLHERFR